MKNYSVAILTKIGPTERETDTLTLVKISAEKEDILREAFKTEIIFGLISKGHRIVSTVYDEI